MVRSKKSSVVCSKAHISMLIWSKYRHISLCSDTCYRRVCVNNGGSCVWRRSSLPFCLRSPVNSMDKDSPDVHQELNKLKTKIQEVREQVAAMPGIDMSPALQESRLRMLREQVRTKNQLLQKYKSLCMFDIPKPSWHWPHSEHEHLSVLVCGTDRPTAAGHTGSLTLIFLILLYFVLSVYIFYFRNSVWKIVFVISDWILYTSPLSE